MNTEKTGQQTRGVSVVICAYTLDRWEELVAAINSVQQQTLSPKEIVVVIDHNPILLQKVQKTVSDVIVIENTGVQGLSEARNSGIAATTGEFIAFLDDDATAFPDWLRLLDEQLRLPNVLGLGGAVEPFWKANKPAWFPEEFYWVVGCTYRGLPQKVQKIRNPIGASMCLRRDVFTAVGGFSSEIGRVGTRPIGCEETELCLRAQKYWPGNFFLYQPLARVSHNVPANRATWRYFRSRCYAEGLSKAVVARLAGANAGLSSERAYTLKTLPTGVLRGIQDGIFHRDASGFLRAGAIVIGLFTTALGYVVGKASRPALTRVENVAHQDIKIEEHAY